MTDAVSRQLAGLIGPVLFVAGLAVIRAHNRWRLDWTLLVTVLGWLRGSVCYG